MLNRSGKVIVVDILRRETSRSRCPARCDQTPPPGRVERYVRLVESLAVPELARDHLVPLIQGFAVVGEGAAPDLVATPQPRFLEPIWVGQALPRGGDDVGLASGQNRLRLVEAVDATGHHHRN